MVLKQETYLYAATATGSDFPERFFAPLRKLMALSGTFHLRDCPEGLSRPLPYFRSSFAAIAGQSATQMCACWS